MTYTRKMRSDPTEMSLGIGIGILSSTITDAIKPHTKYCLLQKRIVLDMIDQTLFSHMIQRDRYDFLMILEYLADQYSCTNDI